MKSISISRFAFIISHVLFRRCVKTTHWLAYLLLFTFYFLLFGVFGQTPGLERVKMYQKHLELTESSILKNLEWQYVGPTNISGRMTDVEVVSPKGKNYTIYIAGASGGVWKTSNEGISWEPVFENAMSTSIGDIALDPQDQNTLWVGTGEANIFRSSQAGAGIYRTKDAGKTWEHLGLVNTNTISRIIVHPHNSDVVYVAASGNEWTDNKERGLYKTSDGGQNWELIFYIDERTGIIDLIMDPTDPNIMYAASWERIRKKWNDPRNEDGYGKSGIYKTLDGGVTWKEINKGLPEAKYRGRIGIDLCKAHPETLYAFVDNYEKLPEDNDLNSQTDSYGRPSSGRIYGATVYRSDNAGGKWKKVSKQNNYMERLSGTYGWVFGQIRVDPVNPDKIYVMGLALNMSEDGGRTYAPLYGMHGDHHGLWIDPENTEYLVNANDGGVAIAYDGKNFRTFYDELPLVQFFNVNVDMDEPFHVYGSIQDHGSRKGVVDFSRGRNRIQAVEFEYAPGGEGSNHVIHPENPNIVYSAGFYGTLYRSDFSKDEQKKIMPEVAGDEAPLRGQWLAPFILSPHNPGIIYHGTQYVHRSMNEGKDWERISPDLTYNKPEKIGDIQYQTIFTISESPFTFGLIYAGTDDGRIWRTENSGKDWIELGKDLPEKWMSRVVASQYNKSTVYLAQNGKRDDDWKAYLWKSEDFGNNWTDITANIPCGPINVIREDPFYENVLYVGTDYGVYVSLDQGMSWVSLAGELPTTYVHDLVIHPRDHFIIIATHGRGIWALDAQIIPEIAKLPMNTVCKIMDFDNPMLPYSSYRWYSYTAKPLYTPYYVASGQDVEIEIEDSEGQTIIIIDQSADKGLNYLEWNLKDKDGKLVEDGEYIMTIKGEKFEKVQSFTILPYQR